MGFRYAVASLLCLLALTSIAPSQASSLRASRRTQTDGCRSITMDCVATVPNDALMYSTTENLGAKAWAIQSGTNPNMHLGDDKNDDAFGFIFECNTGSYLSGEDVIQSAHISLSIGKIFTSNPLAMTTWYEGEPAKPLVAVDTAFGGTRKTIPSDWQVEAMVEDAMASFEVVGTSKVRFELTEEGYSAFSRDGVTQFRVKLEDTTNANHGDNRVVFWSGMSSVSSRRPKIEVEACTCNLGPDGTCDDCPDDPEKTDPGQCGCGVAETGDSDEDGVPDCVDNCPTDDGKTEPGVCGCGIPETDLDSDGTPDCNDGCPTDPLKTAAGDCGCGTPETDSDSDGTPDCNDACPSDADKTAAGVCGCGVEEEADDADGDGAADCSDGCPADPLKTEPGVCGCGIADTDTDSDGTPDCSDDCPSDPTKTAAGECGCGNPDTDSDSDGTPDCNDACPSDADKTAAGACGCGSADTDSDSDGTPDCNDNCPSDPLKTEPGDCGCGVSESSEDDQDEDGVTDCLDGCPLDPLKTAPGTCGCGTADTDSDSDGTLDCNEECDDDPLKTAAGTCGCGVADTDSDSDGTPDCKEECDDDPLKTVAGDCGCGTPETDSDSDGTPDCNDACSSDPLKTAAGECGCGTPDTDTDSDGTPDCNDACPSDPAKTVAGICGCGTSDTDSDSDGTPDCNDNCPDDPDKTAPGICGCGLADGVDLDMDGEPDCLDLCPDDLLKLMPGQCGCGVPDTDTDSDGTADCNDMCPDDPSKTMPGLCGCGAPDTTFPDDPAIPDCAVQVTVVCDGGEAQTRDGRLVAQDGVGKFSCSVDSSSSALRVGPNVGFIVHCDLPDDLPAALDGWSVIQSSISLQSASPDPPVADGSLMVDFSSQFGGDPALQATDYHATPELSGLAKSVAVDDSALSLTLNEALLSTADRSQPHWQFRVTSTAALESDFPVARRLSSSYYVAFAPGSASSPDSSPSLTLTFTQACPDGSEPGVCGCGVADTDSDGDGLADCVDSCASDANKVSPGVCGCGTADTDSDDDGTLDCNDGCPDDGGKTEAGTCGCGMADSDSDGDGTPDCNDSCPSDGTKTSPGLCGCGVVDTDADCLERLAGKPRAVILTDIGILDVSDEKDKDDIQSLVRLLLYADVIDIEGLIATTAWHGKLDARIWSVHPETIHTVVDAYGAVRGNLLKHSGSFPTAEALHAMTKRGQLSATSNFFGGDHMANVGAGKSTEASQHIIDVLRKDDPRPIWFLGWGKLIDLAQALYDLPEAELAGLIPNIKVYDIAGQDNAGAYIAKTWPTIFFLRSANQFQGMSYIGGDRSTFQLPWFNANVVGKGALADVYPSYETSHSVVEGDTPSFLYLLPTGMAQPDQQSWGGWGGRFNTYKSTNPRKTTNDDDRYRNFYMYADAKDSSSVHRPVYRWRDAYQNAFVSRLDWCTKEYMDANHDPVAVAQGDTTLNTIVVSVSRGTSYSLSAAGSSDPDGDSLSYFWGQYTDVGSYSGLVTVTNQDSQEASVFLPNGAAGYDVHIILQVTDDGSPALTSYRRIVINIV